VRTLCVRLAVALGTLLLISIITFAATNAVPSDPARVALGKLASPAEVEQYRKSEGLDRPLVPRYFEWLGRYVRGDWATPCWRTSCRCAARSSRAWDAR
jgi:peptide/nickel transport system permease protein